MQDDIHPSKDIIGSQGTELRGKKVVLGITGSVAAVQSPDIARALMRRGAEVIAVFSSAAQLLIHPNLMEWATGNQVITELTGKIEHIALAGNHERKVDLILIAPATANTISKIAMGIDDTPVTSIVTTAFGSGIPIIIMPAMHISMYKHPILEENIKKLKALGVEFVGPRVEEGKAKIATTEEVLDAVLKKLGSRHNLAKIKVLVTAGPTIEYIDPVRIVTSRSSGQMGVETAKAAYERGADVTLVYGRGTVPPPPKIRVIHVETTQNMLEAVISELRTSKYDVLISAAAVADWTPKRVRTQKIATKGAKTLSVAFQPTPKIVDAVKKIQADTFLVLFKAEHNVSDKELIARAYRRLKTANADLIVANDVARPGVGFDTATNELFIIDKNKDVVHVKRTTKFKAANRLLDVIMKKLNEK
jgi:phosphopantothenoylcysteine decarboxylase/phosphopantothenate--cysteine ligase